MDSSRPKINGIFSEETTITLGTGHTKKTQLVKNYCHAEEGQDNTVQVSYLGNDGHPTGIVISMPCEEFLNKYTFEPDFKVKTRQERDTDKHIAMAEKHRSRKEFNSAEWEYHTALKIDPDSIRANFGVGTLYMEMGQADKARDIFKKLSQIEAIFEEENKHIFNEFGIQLRKASMTDEALANYLKAIAISPQDENLYFNVARLYYDTKDWANAMKWIEKSLSINEHFHEARQFEGVIRRALKEQGGGSLQGAGTGSPSADRPAAAFPVIPKG